MLKRGSIVLSIWCGINFILAFFILINVIVLKKTRRFCRWLLFQNLKSPA